MVLLAGLAARGGVLSSFLQELKALGRGNDEAFKSAALLENALLFVRRYEEEIERSLGRENMRTLLSAHPLLQNLTSRVQDLITSARSQGVETQVQTARTLIDVLRGGSEALRQTAETVKASTQAVRAATPVAEAAAAEAAVVAETSGVFARAASSSPMLWLRDASNSGGPYTKWIAIGAGAAILAGATWYWLSE